MPRKSFRIEQDSLGVVRVPADALYGAQTQRAVQNFPVSGLTFPRRFIQALGLIKEAAAAVNQDLGLLKSRISASIKAAAREVEQGKQDRQFPLDIFQTGSATSTHMNANEVIARLASRKLRSKVHPNDHVNMSQSTNDVIPTAIHVSAALEVKEQLLPSLKHLASTLRKKSKQVDRVVKTGRTHLMDAMPIRMGQELGGWAAQIESGIQRVQAALPALQKLAMGGTAVGTGINAHPQFGRKVTAALARKTGIPFKTSSNYFESLSSQDAAVHLSGALKTVAVSIIKIANDLRWMNSGPHAGLGEIQMTPLQPGSSIMPGKINPVIPESAAMAAAQVIGNDVTITIGGASGNFQLNGMLPVIAYNLLQSLQLLANSSRLLADKGIRGFKVNAKQIADLVEKNPILVTALNPIIGYELGAEIAKKAFSSGRKVRDVAAEMTNLSPEKLKRILDPRRLTQGGIQK